MKLVSVLVQLIVAAGASAALASCGGVTSDELAKHPEAHLFYPGSHVRKTSAQSEQVTEAGKSLAMVTTWLSVDGGRTDGIYTWYVSQLTSKGWTLRQSERVNGSFDLFTRGDRDLFEVAVGGSTGEYSTVFSIIPASCATTPPTKVAFANCG